MRGELERCRLHTYSLMGGGEAAHSDIQQEGAVSPQLMHRLSTAEEHPAARKTTCDWGYLYRGV